MTGAFTGAPAALLQRREQAIAEMDVQVVAGFGRTGHWCEPADQ
jgi:hypothetical protein